MVKLHKAAQIFTVRCFKMAAKILSSFCARRSAEIENTNASALLRSWIGKTFVLSTFKFLFIRIRKYADYNLNNCMFQNTSLATWAKLGLCAWV